MTSQSDSSKKNSLKKQPFYDQFPGDYRVSLSASVRPEFVGEHPGGDRFDLHYDGSEHPIRLGPQPKLPARLEGARIQSGTDWVVVNDQHVVDFDSRITIVLEQNETDEKCLLGGRFRGRAQLSDCRKPDHSPFDAKQALSQLKDGVNTEFYLPLVLTVTFDVPREGFDEKQTLIYEDCLPLARSLFLATGRVVFKQGTESDILVDLYQFTLPSKLQERDETGADAEDGMLDRAGMPPNAAEAKHSVPPYPPTTPVDGSTESNAPAEVSA